MTTITRETCNKQCDELRNNLRTLIIQTATDGLPEGYYNTLTTADDDPDNEVFSNTIHFEDKKNFQQKEKIVAGISFDRQNIEVISNEGDYVSIDNIQDVHDLFLVHYLIDQIVKDVEEMLEDDEESQE